MPGPRTRRRSTKTLC
eukprot:SM011490S24190  [mRNA]  locus=s11490:172:345:- [translate_table: standard]